MTAYDYILKRVIGLGNTSASSKAMKKHMHALFFVAFLFHLAFSQIIENIGFGQPTDSIKEGESDDVRIRLEPNSISSDVSGRIVPLSLSQYMNYTFTTPRTTVPQSVHNAITSIVDPAEYEAGVSGRRDFNNTVIPFTLPAGSDHFDIDMSQIINVDGVNEAEEEFILVLEIDVSTSDLELDEDAGILVVTILDEDAIFLHFSNSSYTFSENDGMVENAIKVQKQSGSPPTEVDIPLKMFTFNGNATNGTGGDFQIASNVQTLVIAIEENEVDINPIIINDDDFPEGVETFFLSLMKGDGSETLNIFPSSSNATVIISDNDEARIGFEQSVYSVVEGEAESVEVCITITDQLPLNHGHVNAVMDVLTNSGTATAGDYGHNPHPAELTIERGQERMCSNITISDDIIVEAREEFVVSLVTQSTTFSAGVTLIQENATIVIVDNDGAVVGFAKTNYSSTEGVDIEICITIFSPNQSVLAMSDFEGVFHINATGVDTSLHTTLLTINSQNHEQCFDVTLISDGLIEETEIATLSLELTNNVFGIKDVAPNTTDITITDADTAVIGFDQLTYTVYEQEDSDSTVEVCVQLLNGTIAPGISVNYTLEHDDSDTMQAFSIDSVSASLTAGINSTCHRITVLQNHVVEPNGTIHLRIMNSTLYPPTTVLSTSGTVINIINNDRLQVSVEASSNTISEGTSITLSVGYSGILQNLTTIFVLVTTSPGSATPGVDYEVDITPTLEMSTIIALKNSTPHFDFNVTAIDDVFLEDESETLNISITLYNPTVPGEIENGKGLIEIIILDNEELKFSFNQQYFEVSETSLRDYLFYVMIENFESVAIPPEVYVSISAVVQNTTSNATQSLDYNITRQDLVFLSTTPATGLNVSFEILTDELVEGKEVINITLSDAIIHNLDNKNAAVYGPNKMLLVVIIDDDELTVGFNTTHYVGTEGGSIDVCVEILDGVLGPGILLDYIINAPREQQELPLGREADSATEGTDYTMTARRVPLSAEITRQCVQIQLIEDTIVEIDESFLVQVEQIISSNDPVFGPSPEYTEITIIDNDEILIGFEKSQYQFNESAGFLPDTVNIVRENEVTVSSGFNVTILLQTNSTASEGDFSVPGGFNVIITFSGDDESQSFPLEILDDVVGEGNEVIELLITTPGSLDGIKPGAIQETTITIIEDDFIPYRYNRSDYEFSEMEEKTQVCLEIVSGQLAPDGYISFVLFTSPLTASPGIDYSSVIIPSSITLSAAARQGCAELSITKDELVEGQELFNVYYEVDDYSGSYTPDGNNLTMVTILDSNIAEVGFQSALYTVVEGEQTMVTVCVAILSGELTDDVSLNYAISTQSETAEEGDDYGLTIMPDNGTFSLANNATCHSMLIFNDDSVEPPETFTVSLTATGPSQELFNITLPQTVVQIIDNDSLSIGFEQLAYLAYEDTEEVELCLMFRGPLKADSFVELEITILPGSATDLDYSGLPVPSILTLDVNHTRRCAIVEIINDDIVEGMEMFQVKFSETDGNQIEIVGSNRTNVNLKDDEIIQLQFGQLMYMFHENTSINNSLIEIKIDNFHQLEIRNDVKVSLKAINNATNATQNDYEILQSSNVVIISEGTQSTQIQLRILDDVIVEGVEEIILVLTDGEVIGIEQSTVNTAATQTTVFIQDNDDATIGFLDTTYSTSEGIVTVCVGLQAGLLQSNTIIRYSISVTSITASDDDFKPFVEEGQIETASTISCHNITIVDDDLVESPEDLQVYLHHVFNVASVQHTPNATTVTIEDTDAVRVGFEMSTYSITEIDGTLPITIRIVRDDILRSVHNFSIFLQLNTSSAATPDIDFLIDGGASQEISFGSEEMSKEVNVSSHHDDIGEGDELIILDLVTDVENNVINVNSGQRTTSITIIEDDFITVFTNTSESHSVNEGDVITQCVSIASLGIPNIPPNGYVELSISTSPGTATAAADYTPDPTPSNQLTLNRTQPTDCFKIATNTDSIVEGTEDFSIQFAFQEKSGSFVMAPGGSNTVITIIDDDYFQVGFDRSVYEIGEEHGIVNNEVYIERLNENELQKCYNFTIKVIPNAGPYPAVLGKDFSDIPPLVTFEPVHTMVPVLFTLIDDAIEEGYENFTLQLSYNGPDEDGTVEIVNDSAVVFIKDNDVVVLGFEKSVYVVFEGLATEVCVAVLDREFLNDDERDFIVATEELTNYAANGSNIDFVDVNVPKSISRSTEFRRVCVTFETVDDSILEEPEKLRIRGTPKSHLIEFHPDSAIIWIIDDEGLLLPTPTITSFNCTIFETNDAMLAVMCDPPSQVLIADLLCAVDCVSFQPCHGVVKIDKTTHMFTINPLDYSGGNHTLEIVGVTQTTEILRDTVTFQGVADPFKLTCVDVSSKSGLITVTCSANRVLQSLTCAVDEGTPKICALQFILNSDEYSSGAHTMVVTATTTRGETAVDTLEFESSESSAISALVENREFVAAVTIVAVVFAIFLLLALAICLLIFYHRRVSKYRYRSEHRYGINMRNLSYQEHDPDSHKHVERTTISDSSDDQKSESQMKDMSGKEQLESSEIQDSSVKSAIVDSEEMMQTLSAAMQPQLQQLQATFEKSITVEIETPSPPIDLLQVYNPENSQLQPTSLANLLPVETDSPPPPESPPPDTVTSTNSQKTPPLSPTPEPVQISDSASPLEQSPERQTLLENTPPASTANEEEQQVQLTHDGDLEREGDFKIGSRKSVESEKETKKRTQYLGMQKPSRVARDRHTERLMTGGGKESHGFKITYWREQERKHHENIVNGWKGRGKEKDGQCPAQASS